MWLDDGVRSDGTKIKNERLAKEMRQEDLALLAGLDRTHLSRMESGERNGTDFQLVKIAKVLRVPLTSILAHAEASAAS